MRSAARLGVLFNRQLIRCTSAQKSRFGGTSVPTRPYGPFLGGSRPVAKADGPQAPWLQESSALLSRRSKNVVPKRRADSVSHLIISVMMAEMVLFQPEP